MKRYRIDWIMVNAYILLIMFTISLFIQLSNNKAYNNMINDLQEQIIEIKNEVTFSDANQEMKLH